ncbi:exopolysaccharide biosynthesis polyprenyl glycosylphosphotransferase [Pseudonocardia thermophila]|uniref:Exopolysaccharide biosynthesis polyprenyl glycosylphosphotransferase n=1 Tax=Pseudonocardia thermophila TaxID=1848 RepID=A0A1M6TEQ2_PSETH|nr:sugar transferase [Pseudonocardia thermophila]SHK55512.1 exopolysaccharide biosynthesis polyprenyl glycosylphosphotransferase [Pseudonocardia thermophila]
MAELFESTRASGVRSGGRAHAGEHSSRSTFSAIVFSAELVALVAGVAAGALIAGPVPAAADGIAILAALLLAGRRAWRFHPLVLSDVPALALAVAVPTLLVEIALPVLGLPGRAGALLTGAFVFVLLVFSRLGAFALIRNRRRAGRDRLRAIIVGAADAGTRLGHSLECNPDFGVEVVGYVDDDRPLLVDLGPNLGSVESLPQLVEEHDAELVLVAFGAHADHHVIDAVRELDASPCDVYVVPRMYELHQHGGATELIDGVPLVKLRRPAFRSPSWRLKRVIDVVVSAIALVLVSPVLAVIAIAVRRETGPGIIFKQERIGLHGKPFTLYKFRSLRLADGEGDVRWNIDTDSRLGPVGRFIRATSLDELPQLFNVLKGDMSLVGPRPERPYFVERFNETIPGYRYRHRVPVGLTGYAAVNGLRGDTSIHQRAHYDNLYIESWSLWLDLKIAIWTVQQLIPKRAPEAVLPVPNPPTLPIPIVTDVDAQDTPREPHRSR